MKIRSGFVSNSSSSSFIIEKNDEYKNINELARYMVGRVGYNDNKQPIYDLLDNATKDPNTNIMFYSYTYIYDYGKYMLVNTCNNEDWDLDNYVGESKFVREYPELNNGYGEIDFYKLKGKELWNIERNLMFKETGNYVYCKECRERLVIIMEEEQCPVHFTLIDGTPSKYKLFLEREKKLERIIND